MQDKADAQGYEGLPDDWISCEVRDIVHPDKNSCVGGPFGSNLTSKDYVDVPGVPVSRGNNLTMGVERFIDKDFVFVSERKAATLVQNTAYPGDIVFTQRGTIGQIGLIPGQAKFPAYILSQNQMKLRPDESKANPIFLYYYFISPVSQKLIQQNSIGSTIPGFNLGQLRAFPLVLPPLPEQKAIAHILGTLDDKIELNRRMNATLEAMARALFQSWFVDFDPVRAKLDGRQPAGLDEATAALFPAHFQDSPLGPIPQGWQVTTLGNCIGFRSGFSFKSQDWQESGVPVVKIGSVKPGIIDLSQVSYVSDGIAQQAARYRLSIGDLLIGMTGYVGEVGLVPPTDNLPLLNQRVGKFVLPKPGTESLPFWYCITRQQEFRAFVEARSHGTAQANVSGEAILEYPLFLPSENIIDAFNEACRPILEQILFNHAQSRTLANLRDTLLPKLLNGELAVDKNTHLTE